MCLAMMEAREVVTSMEVAGPLEEEAGKETKVELGARAMLAIVEVVGPLGAVAGHLKTRAMAKVELLGAMASKKRRQTMEIALQLLDLLGAQLDTTHATGSTLRRLMGDSCINCGHTVSCKSPR